MKSIKGLEYEEIGTNRFIATRNYHYKLTKLPIYLRNIKVNTRFYRLDSGKLTIFKGYEWECYWRDQARVHCIYSVLLDIIANELTVVPRDFVQACDREFYKMLEEDKKSCSGCLMTEIYHWVSNKLKRLFK